MADEGEDDEGWLTSTTRSIRSNVVAGSHRSFHDYYVVLFFFSFRILVLVLILI